MMTPKNPVVSMMTERSDGSSAAVAQKVAPQPRQRSSQLSSTALRMTSYAALESSDDNSGTTMEASLSTRLVPQVHPDCPYMYKMPEGLHRYYQPLPAVVQAFTLLVSAWIAALSTWKKLTWWQPLSVLRGTRPLPSPIQWISFLVKALAYFIMTQITLQEIVGRPSRVSIHALVQKYFLPSQLSQYKTISVPGNEPDDPQHYSLGVHFLQYQNPNIQNETTKFDALYLQHGFGASSLSWLPVMPSLIHRLGARVGLAHDAVGFGFTDRPSHQKWYTSKQSARIAHQVLRQHQLETTNPPKAVALMGHSMGSLAMLRLATQLPAETRKFIVLSSPALGINNRKSPTNNPKDGRATWMRRKILQQAQNTVLVPVAKYLLRRIVGTNGSWKAGLEAAWGDPTKVTDGDVLRFSWPAVGLGWEEGILRFASAQGMRQEDELDNDRTLMQRVLDLPNTKVVIILGSKDRVVTPKQVRNFMAGADPKNKVPIIELSGLGHDAFEEDQEMFCGTVDELLESVEWN
jgi:pimeloyl-ACP methyl ester carboxylesterase